MANAATFDQSNKADWAFDITATDADTGESIDFTGASIAFVAKDKSGNTVLSATVDDGITISTTTVSVRFAASDMSDVCPGSYNVGMIYELDDEINQIFTGTVTIYDGIASL